MCKFLELRNHKCMRSFEFVLVGIGIRFHVMLLDFWTPIWIFFGKFVKISHVDFSL